MKFAAATNNQHKLAEMRRILERMGHTVLSQKEAGVHLEPEEDGDTFAANAVIKAKDTDTVVTGRSLNSPVRILKNPMSRQYIKLEAEAASRDELEKLTLGGLRRAVFEGDMKTGSVMMGQIAGLCKEIRPLKDILDSLDRKSVV